MKNKTTKHNKRINKKTSSKKGLLSKRKTKKNRKMMGGNINPPSFEHFQQSPNQYYYDTNSYSHDSSDPSQLIPSRNLPNMLGGKKNKKMKKTLKNKKTKGGMFDPVLGSSSLHNSFTSFGNFGQSSIGSSLVLGEDSTSRMFNNNHPSSQTYNEYSPPLV